MTPTHHKPPRNAKRKAESPAAEEELIMSRPQRKKQKQSNKQTSSPPPPPPTFSTTSPVATSKSPALHRHLIGLYNEIVNSTDDTYDSFICVSKLTVVDDSSLLIL